MRVSFDFDDTLSEGNVQSFAKWCMRKGCEVWIVTSRLPDHKAPSDNWNNDLWWVCEHIGIDKDNVVFTSYADKYEFFWGDENRDFLFHVEDDEDEIKMLGVHCPNLFVINHEKDLHWKDKLVNLIETEMQLKNK